ncbi:MAG: S41 family peptidase [Patescibacteria group bacterium]|jgi:carboxyl-terminal processing protease
MNIKIGKGLGIFLKTVVILLTAGLIFISGASLSTRSVVVQKMSEKSILYLGKITGKYSRNNNQWSQNVSFDLYWDVWNILKEGYVDQELVNDKKMFYGSLKGLVMSLDDPYSEFMDPQENKEFNDDMSGTFEGIGAEIGIRDDILTIISPLEGTPAQKAGLMAGDKILEINGEITKNMNINEAVSKIKGPKGTEVVLSVFKVGLEDIQEIKIIRDTIIIKSVSFEKINENIFLIKINSFNNDTDFLFSQAIKEMISSRCDKVIIDLRNNPGGYLETSVLLLGEWINGQTAVIEKFGDGQVVNYPAEGLNRLTDYPTVILINNGSASASEILAGALKDYSKATIIGEKSYGKGSVQMIKTLEDGSALKMTVAEWLTPQGRNINEEGILPDIEVVLSFADLENDRDPQLQKAIEFLK